MPRLFTEFILHDFLSKVLLSVVDERCGKHVTRVVSRDISLHLFSLPFFVRIFG